MIDGPLIVQDLKNQLKSVVFFNGLIKQSHLFSFEYVANSESKKSVVEGLIYKFNRKKVESIIKEEKSMKVEKLADLFDIDYKLERVFGDSIDKFEIEGIPMSNWKESDVIDPIPSTLALPSDIRFREDLIYMKKGEKSKGKVWKGMLKE